MGQPGLRDELVVNGGAQVDEALLTARALGGAAETRGERVEHFAADLEVFDADAWADRGDQFTGLARRDLRELGNGGGDDARDHAAPAGVDGGHSAAVLRCKQDWHTVR